ncbi:helix-turn-helix domain-containing protein [Streptomyces sp. NPDC005393]|uniref:helix-turn-helix domain-containing protein n=1 Tax=Streptomyces sp. NPDC005393 TaxID=3157041 RepID=UPI0033A337CC
MGRWQPLPGELPRQARRLAEELRLYKDRSELSLASLAAKTAYSATSWHRYLNGRKLPPWRAVEMLGRLVEADRGRLRVLWESAAAAWDGGNASPDAANTPNTHDTHDAAPRTPDVPAPAGDVPAPAGRHLRVPWRAAAAVAAGALLTVLALGHPWSDGHSRPAPRGAPPGAPVWPWPLRSAGALSAGADCAGHGCQGQDPYREGCDRDSTVVHALRAYGSTLALRYSPVCRAVWAEADPVRGTARLLVAAQGAAVRTARRGASRTAMVAGRPDTARACVVVADHQLCVTEHNSWADPVSGGTPRG